MIKICWRNNRAIIIFGVFMLWLNCIGQIYFSGPIHHIYEKIKFLLDKNKTVMLLLALALTSVYTIVFVEMSYLKVLVSIIVSPTDILAAFVITDNLNEDKYSKIIEKLDNYSMGIYLFHTPLISVFLMFVGSWRASFACIVCFGGSVLISIGLTMLLRKMKLSFIIGENSKTYQGRGCSRDYL